MTEVPHRVNDACKAWEESVDKLLADPIISVEESIATAIRLGRMTAEEGQECLNAYLASFFSGEGEAPA